MNKTNDFPKDADLTLNALGGEALSDSGFENEIPEPEFAQDDREPEGTER